MRLQRISLLLLRVALGGLMVYWGVDKLINAAHGVGVAEKYYGGVSVGTALMQGFGVAQLSLGVLVIAGLFRRIAYPALLLVTGTTLLGVWKSIVDPLKLAIDGGNLIFYPSLIIFAGVLVLIAFRDHDTWVLGARQRS